MKMRVCCLNRINEKIDKIIFFFLCEIDGVYNKNDKKSEVYHFQWKVSHTNFDTLLTERIHSENRSH